MSVPMPVMMVAMVMPVVVVMPMSRPASVSGGSHGREKCGYRPVLRYEKRETRFRRPGSPPGARAGRR